MSSSYLQKISIDTYYRNHMLEYYFLYGFIYSVICYDDIALVNDITGTTILYEITYNLF